MFFEQKYLLLGVKFLCPLILAYFTMYGNPQLIFFLIQWEKQPRKSVKEVSFLSKLNIMLVFNLVFAPLIAMVSIDLYDNVDDLKLGPLCLKAY